MARYRLKTTKNEVPIEIETSIEKQHILSYAMAFYGPSPTLHIEEEVDGEWTDVFKSIVAKPGDVVPLAREKREREILKEELAKERPAASKMLYSDLDKLDI